MNRFASRFFQISALLLTLLVTSQAQAIYKWIDENGKVQYSDLPPPPNARQSGALSGQPIPAKQQSRTSSPVYGSEFKDNTPTPTNAPAGNNTPNTSTAQPTSKGKTTAELDAEYKKRKEEQEKTAEKARQKQQEDQARAEICQRARTNMETLQSGRRMRVADASGDSVVMDDNMRLAEVDRIQRIMQENKCN